MNHCCSHKNLLEAITLCSQHCLSPPQIATAQQGWQHLLFAWKAVSLLYLAWIPSYTQLLTQPQTWLSTPQEENPVTHWEPQRDQLCAVNPVAAQPSYTQILSTALSWLCTGEGGVRNLLGDSKACAIPQGLSSPRCCCSLSGSLLQHAAQEVQTEAKNPRSQACTFVSSSSMKSGLFNVIPTTGIPNIVL